MIETDINIKTLVGKMNESYERSQPKFKVDQLILALNASNATKNYLQIFKDPSIKTPEFDPAKAMAEFPERFWETDSSGYQTEYQFGPKTGYESERNMQIWRISPDSNSAKCYRFESGIWHVIDYNHPPTPHKNYGINFWNNGTKRKAETNDFEEIRKYWKFAII